MILVLDYAKIQVRNILSRITPLLTEWIYAENGAAVLFALLGFLLRIPIISSHFPASGVSSAGCWLVAALISLYFCRDEKLPSSLLFLVLFAAYVSVVSLTSNWASISMLFTRLATIVGASLFAICDRKHFQRTSFLFSALTMVLLIADILSVLAFPRGIFDTGTGPSWILGYKNLRADFLILMIAVVSVQFSMQRSRENLAFLIAASITSLVDLALCKSTSGVAGVAVEILVIVAALSFPKSSNVLRRFWAFFAVYIAIFFMVVVFRDSDFVRNVMAVIFQKDPTLTGRTAIWNGCLFAIEQTGQLGLGAIPAPLYFEVTGGFYNAHNQIVDIALLGGIPGTALYFLFVGTTMGSACMTDRNKPLCIAIYSMLIIGIVSGIFTYSPLFYYLLFSIEPEGEETGFIDSLAQKERHPKARVQSEKIKR